MQTPHHLKIFSGLALCATLQGQTTAPVPAAARDPDVVELMTYTVTAKEEAGYYSANAISGTRTQTALVDLPLTVNVVTSELYTDIGAVKFEEGLRYTPGVRKTGDFEGTLSVRGFRETTPRFNGIATFNTSRWDSAVIDRVEVLKGPSAALYGSTAAAGGFANILSKKPSFKTQREVGLNLGSAGRFRATVDLTGPFSSTGMGAKFAYRVIGVHQDGSNNSWRDYADGERFVLSPSVTWRPSERTEVTLEYYRDRYDRVMDVVTQPLKLTNQSRLYFNELSPEFNINGPDSFDEFEMDAGFLYITHRITDALTLRTISAVFESNTASLRRQGFVERAATPQGGGILATFGLNRHPNFDRQWHRMDVQWKKPTKAGTVTALLGLQYLTDRDGNDNFQDTTEPPFPLFSYTDANFKFKPLSSFRQTEALDSYAKSWLLNGVLNYGILDNRLNLFGNYAHSLRAKGRSVNTFAGQTKATVPWNKSEDPDDYQVGASFKLTPAVSAYALFGSDIRLNARDSAGVQLPNVTQDMVEAGMKFAFGPRFNGSVALFDITRANLAVRDFSLPTQPLTPSGEERSRGAELELYFTPVRNLDVIFGYTFLDAEIVSHRERPILEGSALQDAPRNSASVWTRYRFPKGDATGLTVGLGLVYSDEMNPFGTQTAQLRALAVAPKYFLVNAMARYPFDLGNGRQLSVQVSLRNITDQKYFEGTDYGPPFNGDLSLNYKF